MSLLPFNAQPAEQALLSATSLDWPVPVSALYQPDRCPVAALPHLAGQLHVLGSEGWDLAKTEAEKRALLKRAIELHRYKGTPWSIKAALSALGFESVVREWFETDGEPHTFRVEVDTTDRAVSEALLNRIVALVLEYKNLRSHLSTVGLHAATRANAYVGAALIGADHASVLPCMTTRADAPPSAYRVGLACLGWGWTSVFPRS